MSASPKQPAGTPNWRGNAGAASPARGIVRSWRRPGAGVASWRPVRGQFARWLFSAVASVMAALAMILFVALVFLPGCSVTRIAVLTVPEYSDRGLPPFAFAQADADLFQKRFQGVSLEGQIPQPSAEVKRGLTSGGSKSVLIVWLATLAGRADKGVLLYQPQSHPDESETAMPLDRVWEFLKGLPTEQKKLVILDVARGPVDWRWGQFGPPFAAPDQSTQDNELTRAVASVPNLAILTATAPDETSWSSPHLQHSIFANMVARGLFGDADRIHRDQRITLDELFEFVREETTNWVAQNRDLRGQHPRLILPESADAATALRETIVGHVRGKWLTADQPKAIDKSQPADKPSAATTSDARSELIQLWERRDRLKAVAPEQVDPLAWRALHEQLRRAERQWLAGQPQGISAFVAPTKELLERLQRRVESPAVKINEYPFVAASIQRATAEGSTTSPRIDPPLPDDQLQRVLKSLAPENTSPDLVKQAVQTRLLAERLAWRAYRPRVWVGELLVQADQERRRGEDLLFVDPSHAERSEAAFKAANEKLKQLEDWTRELTESRQLLDRLWSELPELAHWAAHRFPIEDATGAAAAAKSSRSPRQQLMSRYAAGIDKERFDPPTSAELQQMLEGLDAELPRIEADVLTLFEQARRLSRLLDVELEAEAVGQVFNLPAASKGQIENLPQKLAQLRKTIQDPERGLTALQLRLQRHAEALLSGAGGDSKGDGAKQAQYFHWQRLQGALQWTGLNADVRQRLLREWERTDESLHARTAPVAQHEKAVSESNGTWGMSAQWQSLWALQVVSLGLPPEQSLNQDWVDWKNSLLDEQKRRSLLVSLGDSVRSEFQARRQRVSVPTSADDALARSLQLLWRAERAARTLHGYDALLIPENQDPLPWRRDLEWSALCLRQAERYAEDFWGRLQPDDRETWFASAADRCLQAGRRINSAWPPSGFASAFRQSEDAVKQRQSAKLELVRKDTRLDLGLKGEQTTNVSANKTDGIPDGLAALWLVPDDTTRLEILPATRRALFETNSPATEFSIRRRANVPNSVTNCASIPVQPQLLFRGRWWNSPDDAILVSPCPPQAIEIVSLAAPRVGEIVVEGLDRRETVFILDCSASMDEKTTNQAGAERMRIEVAKEVLRDTLRTLHEVAQVRNEPPHIIGVVAYGHRARLQGGQTVINPDWKRRVVPPDVQANWRLDYEWLTKQQTPQPLNLEELKRLEEEIAALPYYGNTPLLGSMLFAAEPLIKRKTGGLVVAITDGVWNDESPNQPGPRYNALEQLFQNHPELALHLVVFGGVKEDERRNLQSLAAKVRAPSAEARTGRDLTQTLEKAMRPRKYRVSPADTAMLSRVELPLAEPAENLVAGSYRLSFPDCPEMPLTLVGGERLVFDLDLASRKLKHRKPRLQLFRPASGVPADAIDEPTRFGYLSARYDKVQKRAEFKFALDRDDDLSFVRRPAEISIDVQPQGVRREFTRTIQLELQQSVPAWRVTVEQWPADAMPEVQAFWKMSRSEPEQRVPLAKALAGPQTINASEQKWQVRAEADGRQIRVEVAEEQSVDATAKRQELLSGLRVELGLPRLDQQFEPTSANVRAQLFEKEGRLISTFAVAEDFPLDQAVVAVTTRAKREQECRRIDPPLRIAKWDTEQ